MWQEYLQPTWYQITDQEPPLAELLDPAYVIVLIEKNEQGLKVYGFPTLSQEIRELIRNVQAAKLLANLEVAYHVPEWDAALMEGTGVLYLKMQGQQASSILAAAS